MASDKGPNRPAWKTRTIDFFRHRLDSLNGAMVARSPMGDHEFFDPAAFPWTRRLEDAFPKIRAELDQVLAEREVIPDFSEISRDQAHLAPPRQWKTFFLHAYGYRADENCARCPETAAAVESIPGMWTAFFSILAPGARIKPHRGPYRGVLRYHLGLRIPRQRDRVGIRVGESVAHWREGGSLVFDDGYRHEAWNETEEERVVLFVDFLRPLPPALDLVNRSLIRIVQHSPLVQEGRRNFDRWNADHARERNMQL